MSDAYESAERVIDEAGRQYHIGLAPGELADSIVTCGDPDRARRIVERFDEIEVEVRNREFVTFTGSWEGFRLSVMATGIGCDNTEIAVVESCQVVEEPTFIRVGTCGALQPEIGLGELVVSTGACRLESTSTFFVHEGFPAVAHHEVVTALIDACVELKSPHHVGVTATAAGFYGAQGRRGLGFEPRFPDLPDQLARMGVKNFEMEASALFTLCAMRGFRAGAVCTVFANRPQNVFIPKDDKEAAENRAIDVGLDAIRRLSIRD